MNSKKIADLQFGLDNEKKWLRYMGDDWKKTPNKYDSFDFLKNNEVAELKSRKINHNKFTSAMFGANKIYDILTKKYGDYTKMKFTFYFLYRDGLYKWDFRKGQYFIAKGGRKDRGKDEIGWCCYVPLQYLQCISTKIRSMD